MFYQNFRQITFCIKEGLTDSTIMYTQFQTYYSGIYFRFKIKPVLYSNITAFANIHQNFIAVNIC